LEIPASQQGGREYLLGLRNQLQETRNRSQAFLEQQQKALEQMVTGLDQHIALIQQREGSSEVSASRSHYGSHQQDIRPLENSFHPPARNEQSMPQQQQREVLSINDYHVCPSDSDNESGRREPLEAQRPAGSPPARSYQIPPESRSYWEVLLQAKESYPQHSSGYLNLISLDQRSDLYMRQREITEGKKSFKNYILKHEHEAFKSGRRMKSNKISETKLPLRERVAYMIYNRFRSI